FFQARQLLISVSLGFFIELLGAGREDFDDDERIGQRVNAIDVDEVRLTANDAGVGVAIRRQRRRLNRHASAVSQTVAASQKRREQGSQVFADRVMPPGAATHTKN